MTTGLQDSHCRPDRLRKNLASARCPPGHAGRAFTLLELILVLALIGVVLAMAAPSLRGFVASRQATDTAAQILALTQLARSRASAEGRVYRLNIESETGTYWLTAQCRGTFADLNTGLGRHFDCPDGVTISLHSATDQDEPEHIEFHPTGRTDQATIKVNDRRGEAFHVVCQSATEPFHVIKASQALKDETQ